MALYFLGTDTYTVSAVGAVKQPTAAYEGLFLERMKALLWRRCLQLAQWPLGVDVLFFIFDAVPWYYFYITLYIL